MRKNLAVVVALLSSSLACAGSPAGLAPDAADHTVHGLTVVRPEGWRFVPPDQTVTKDTVVILQGPVGDKALAPVVEIARRPLNAADQRRAPSHILTALVGEVTQTYESFELSGAPREIELGGRPAARVDLSLVESLSDGTEEARALQMYVLVHGEQLWLVRCLGPADGSAGAAFEGIVNSIKL